MYGRWYTSERGADPHRKTGFELVQREQEIRDVEFKTEAVSYGKDVFRRFLRSKTTVVAACITLFIILMGIVGPYISPYNYLEQNVELKNYAAPASRDWRNLVF